VSIPENVFITHENFHKDKNEEYYIQMCGKKFYLPEKVAILI